MNDEGLLLPWALRDGELIHVTSEDVPSGLDCGCICPECQQPVIAKKGTDKRHHFSHQGLLGGGGGSLTCTGGFETAAHLRAKQIIAEARRIKFPKNTVHTKLDEVILERHLSADLRPDITVLYEGGRKAVIEIFVTHRCTATKLAWLRRENVPSFEINLQRWRHTDLNDGFANQVIWAAQRTWIFDPSRESVEAQIRLHRERRVPRDTSVSAKYQSELTASGNLAIQAQKQAWVRAYDARRCAHPRCDIHPSFGYGPPFCQKQAWTCREHRAWFEASVQEGVVAR